MFTDESIAITILYERLYISFSKKHEGKGNTNVGLQFDRSSLEPSLKIDDTRARLILGKIP